MPYRAGTASEGLHDLKRPWRYWLWGGDAVEVPSGKTHEEVAECIIPDEDLPPGRSAQSVLLDLGAVKQWDLHFISGSKRREALTAVQDQLWRMVEEEVLSPQRAVMLTLGDVYELLNVLDVVSARTVNELTTHRGGVRENPRDQSFSWQPWRAWYFQDRWIVLPKDQVHVEVANGLLDVADPGWRSRKPQESDLYLMRKFGAIKQWGMYFGFSGESWIQFQIIQDRVVEMLQQRPGIDLTDVVEIAYGKGGWVDVTVDDLLNARNLRDLVASSSLIRPNVSYLEQAKRHMAESYGEATTDFPGESGYLLPDGSWLKMGHGTRGDDHRIVAGFVRGRYAEEARTGSRWHAVERWMRVTGAIRWMPENCSFDLYAKPTREQLNSMYDAGKSCTEVQVELNGPRGRHEVELFGPRELERMLDWVREFWR